MALAENTNYFKKASLNLEMIDLEQNAQFRMYVMTQSWSSGGACPSRTWILIICQGRTTGKDNLT